MPDEVQVPYDFHAAIVSREQLQEALDRQAVVPKIRLGEALVNAKRITRDQLHQALELQKHERTKQLGEILIDAGHITRPDLYRALSQQLAIPAVDLKNFTLDPLALEAVPEAMVRELMTLPLCFDRKAIVVAMINPLDPAPAERVRLITQRAVRAVLARPEDLVVAIRLNYGLRPGRQPSTIG